MSEIAAPSPGDNRDHGQVHEQMASGSCQKLGMTGKYGNQAVQQLSCAGAQSH